MQPSQVREKILLDHAVIRTSIENLNALIAQVRSGDEGAGEHLTRDGCTFLEFLVTHIERENRVLVPAIREIDAWGEVRAEQLLKEHTEQTAEARSLIEALADAFTRPPLAADQLESFLAELEADMAMEERVVLSEDLLRDDIIGIDVEAG